MTVGRVVPVLNIIKDRSTNMYRVLITDDEKIEREELNSFWHRKRENTRSMRLPMAGRH